MSLGLTRTRPHARVLRPLAVLAGTVALTATLASCSGGQPAAPAFDLVSRATVANGVTASGALAAKTSEQLGFAQGGKLTKVAVKVGQKVEEGDVLATIDAKTAKEALKQAEANVDAQAAGLAGAAADPSVQSAAASLAQARTVVDRTNRQADATLAADSTAISRAKKQRSVDRDAKDDAEDAVDQAKDACSDARAAVKTATDAAEQAAATPSTPAATVAAAALTSASQAAATACGAVGSAQAGVTAAKQRLAADDTAVTTAEERKRVDQAAGRLACANAEQGVVSARNAYNAAVAARPHTLDAQQAGVDAAQAQVETAQKAVDDTVLRAPSAGTVSAVNGAKGEYVSASTGTSALAPGSSAAIPGASGAGGAAAGAASPTRPGGSQLIVLSGLDTLQVVLPFEESDAATIKAGDGVDVQLDALPDLTSHGKVVSVSPSATPISGVVSYYVTVALDDRDPRERDGQTARATVLTEEHTGVLTVPNTAVRQQGGASTVVVYEPSGEQRTVTFEAGLVGPDRTEVLSGLNEGDRVVVPSHP
ncbi:HlyD family secretion protein [Microlunatus sagamiharensis]|uniref:HlyD family secretion protein n=1 Tax=Microlunatus sagamiharensis TaxID=546874 RepID=A0A1H2NDM9_9ACTN|nr:biotin/lipoyl-binding protein [Microlunatus sagamiharensis]SDV02936.1 HlyD family secretion protein [Microlunatus sagamiharensis]